MSLIEFTYKIDHKILESLHIICVISWMASLLYLPRLFVYHVNAIPGGELDSTLKVMEKRLLKYIMNPSMILTIITGTTLVIQTQILQSGMKWIHYKFLVLFIMFGFHGMCSRYIKIFSKGGNKKSSKFYKIFNEVPTVLMIIIVILAVKKPF